MIFKNVTVVCSLHVRNSILINLVLINPKLQGVRDHFCFGYDYARREISITQMANGENFTVKYHFIELIILQLKVKELASRSTDELMSQS